MQEAGSDFLRVSLRNGFGELFLSVYYRGLVGLVPKVPRGSCEVLQCLLPGALEGSTRDSAGYLELLRAIQTCQGFEAEGC